MTEIFNILIFYLKHEGYHIDGQLIKERLFSDSNDSLVSITNTLDYFDIENIVATVPKAAFNELPKLFIAQVRRNHQFNLVLVDMKNGDFIKVRLENDRYATMSKEEFLNDWTGLIVAIEKNKKPKKTKDLDKRIMNVIGISCLLFMVMHYGFIHSPFFVIYGILSIIGFVSSCLILKGKLNGGSIPSKLCVLSKNANCKTVLNSKEAKLFEMLDLGDVSIVYFSFSIVAFSHIPSSIVFLYLSVASLPIAIYSLYHQYFKIQKWCPLCLVIVFVLLLKNLVMLFVYDQLSFEYLTIFPLLVILGVLTMCWMYMKPLLSLEEKNNELNIENLTLRRNHNLFLPYYHSLKETNVLENSIPTIKMGTSTSLVSLTIITNPLCKACKEIHNTSKELLKKYSNDLQVNFCFLVPTKHGEDTRTKISERLLQLYYEEGADAFQEAFGDWYRVTKANVWFAKWKECTDMKYNNMLKEQVKWCLANEVASTPRILINGKLFPESYHPNDIENFIEPIVEFEKNK